MAKPKRKVRRIPIEVIEDAARGSVPDGKLADAVIHSTEGLPSEISGMTGYDRATGKVTELYLPTVDDAYGQTVRGHEGRHATLPHEKYSHVNYNDPIDCMVSQIVDDCIIEQLDLPETTSRSYKRTHIATAMRDLHRLQCDIREHQDAMVRMGMSPDEPLPWDVYNGVLCAASRASAILSAYQDDEERYDRISRRQDRLNKAIGDDYIVNLIGQILWDAKGGMHKEAFQILRSIMEEPPKKGGKPKGKTDKPYEPDGKPKKHDGDQGKGDAELGYMEIVELLPRHNFCVREKQVDVIYAPSGCIINPRRLVAAKIGKTANGLFSRRVQQKPGGTVVIDASGSMGITQERLARLCRAIPTATIAYYNGGGGDNQGKLFVYARNGKRYTPPEGSDLPMAGGNNTVDLPAIQWLLKQDPPFTMVTDLQFCGGPYGHPQAALVIARRNKKAKRLHVIPAIHEAIKFFEQKKEVK